MVGPSPRSRAASSFSATRERSRIEVPLAFARRGVYELGPAEVRVADPFGLLSASPGGSRRGRRWSSTRRSTSFGASPCGAGTWRPAPRGARGRRGEEFANLREYRRGDDRRHIHWKSLARTGELFVKEFSVQAPRRHTVALDLRREGLRTQEQRGRGRRLGGGLGSYAPLSARACLSGCSVRAVVAQTRASAPTKIPTGRR